MHFCFALLISVILSAPWPNLADAVWALGASGIAGLIYAAVVVHRATRVSFYTLVLEDWAWHTAFPLVAYGAIIAGAWLLRSHAVLALFTAGAATVLLLFIGIHNAWDTVTHVTITRVAAEREKQD